MNFPESPWLKILCSGSEQQPAEIAIDGRIGTSYWDPNSVGERDFKAALAAIPQGRKIIVSINSEGGNVKDGLGIYHAIRARKQDVTCRIDGFAWSIASVIAIAGGNTLTPKVSVWMIHDPWTFCEGNADAMRAAADMLDANAKTLVAAYAEKTGKTEEEIREAMKRETWLTGEEAIAWGLASETSETQASAIQLPSNNSIRMPARIVSHMVQNSARPKPIASNHQEEQSKVTRMKLLLAALAGAKLIPSADNIDDEKASTAVVASLAKRDSDAKALQSELTTERTAREKAETDLAKCRKDLAEASVAADVKAGLLKDDASLRAKWVESYTKDFDGTKALIAGMAEAKPTPITRGVSLESVKCAKETEDRETVVEEFAKITDPSKRAAYYAKHKATLLG